MDEDEFIRFLLEQGYAGPEARDLVDQALNGDADYLNVRDRDGRPVEVEVDSSMGFAGLVQFIVPATPEPGSRPAAPARDPGGSRSSRPADLLKAAADALDDGQDPLARPFLSAHDITYDECQDLAGWLAIGARLTAWATENPRQAAIAAQAGADFMKLDAITQLLRKLSETAPGPAGGTQ